VIAAIAIAGCAHKPHRVGLGLPSPNPNGCYVLVYDQPDWRGAGVVLNGPARWPSLERLLAAEENWRNRIRSIAVGPVATATAHTDAAFRGASRRLAPNSQHPRLENELNARIESLELSCSQPTSSATPK
jgi:hypothetical protein